MENIKTALASVGGDFDQDNYEFLASITRHNVIIP